MQVLTEGPKINVGAKVMFCKQKVRFYQLIIRSASTSCKEQRLHPSVDILID